MIGVGVRATARLPGGAHRCRSVEGAGTVMAGERFYRTGVSGEGGLIVTARLREDAQSRLETWRRAHYPADRNQVPAHLTLFHALPLSWLEEIDEHLTERCWNLDPLPGRAVGLRFMGHGVCVEIDAPALVRLRAALAVAWRAALSPQDRQRFAPHVTIQNKVPPAKARRTLQGLEAVFEPFNCDVEGLSLWRYRGGPWDAVADFPFGAGPADR